MKTSEALIDFEQFKKDYPLTANHIFNMLSGKETISFQVNEEDIHNLGPFDSDICVQFSYRDEDEMNLSFSMILPLKYVSFDEFES